MKVSSNNIFCNTGRVFVSSEELYRMDMEAARKEVCEDRPLFSSSLMSYNGTKVRGKADVPMSFVGLIRTGNTLIGFGDTRSTVHDELGNQVAEQGRTTRKVFRNHNSLIVTYGPNKVGSIKIEDILSKEIMAGSDTFGILANISSMLKEYGFTGISYNFIIGTQDEKDICFYDTSVSSAGILIVSKVYMNESNNYTYKHHFVVSQIGFFTDWFHDIMREFDSNDCPDSPDDIKRYIKRRLTERIRQAEEEFPYSPVGLPVLFETITF